MIFLGEYFLINTHLIFFKIYFNIYQPNRYCANRMIEAGVIPTIIGGINSIILPKMYYLLSLIIAGPLLIFVVVKTNKFIS